MRLAAFASALLVLSGSAIANDGLLDSSFGIFSSGRNLVAINQGGTDADQLADTLVAADGSIFLVGTSRGEGGVARYSISKLTRDGIVDTTFGTNGSVLSALPNLIATRARFDGDGNILIAGSRGISGLDRDFALCRYNQQGEPVIFSGLLNACAVAPFDIAGGNLTDIANDVIVEPNGNIVLAGVAGISGTRSRAAVVRLLPTGLRDPAFGVDGKNASEPSAGFINQYNAIARRADGKYVAVGEFGDKDSVDGIDALFARLTANGSLDPSYAGGAGYANYGIGFGQPFDRYDAATQVTILGNGKMLVAGTAQAGPNSDHRFAFIYRVNPTNAYNRDDTFAGSGQLRVFGVHSFDLGDLFVQSDGKLLIIGTHRESAGIARDVMVARISPAGTPDLGFGANSGGRTYIDFNAPGELDYGIAGALQNGRIIVAGHSLNTAPLNYDLTVAGLSLDLIFANNFDGQ